MPDLSAVLCPPYDIISETSRERLLARDPHNAVRLELPAADPGAVEGPYREAARALAEWRSDGTLVKDRQPTLHVHEMRWRPGGGVGAEQTARAIGFFARVRLEPLTPGSRIRPHERTMDAPKEDRFRLLKATGANLSPVVLLHEADPAQSAALVARLTDRPPDAVAHTDDGVGHRLWSVPVERDEAGDPAGDAAALLALVERSPLTIADGHHRYETALRYREERGRNRACESDPAWDYVLALLYRVADAPPVLPTHRLLVDGPRGEALLAALDGLSRVERLSSPAEVLARMAEPQALPDDATGTGRIGLVSGTLAAVLTIDDAAAAGGLDPALSAASRGLDVNRAAVALGRLGVDAQALASSRRVAYVKDGDEAVARAASGSVAAAFLLDGPPVTAVTRVAAAGELMPQKSTYFHPKAPTGLVFGPLEW
jgi:uncharacterized protein (DUF1015 family)